jgi:hypothetical protein
MTDMMPVTPNAEMQEWDRLLSGAVEVAGYSLIGGKENEKTISLLEGVPFLIENVTFRPGDITPDGQDGPRDYVSVECLVAPQYRNRFPRAHVVFNDGSTGIYRNIVKELAKRDYVTLPEGPEDGEANTTRYDVSFSSGEDQPVTFPRINIFCPEGLRKSEYSRKGAPDGTTWYIA